MLQSSNSSVQTVIQAQKEHKLHSEESFSVKNELLGHFLSFCNLPTGIRGVRRQSCLAPGQCRQTRTSRASCGFKLALRILRATWTDDNGTRRKRAEAHGNCWKLIEVAGNMAEFHGSMALQIVFTEGFATRGGLSTG